MTDMIQLDSSTPSMTDPIILMILSTDALRELFIAKNSENKQHWINYALIALQGIQTWY